MIFNANVIEPFLFNRAFYIIASFYALFFLICCMYSFFLYSRYFLFVLWTSFFPSPKTFIFPSLLSHTQKFLIFSSQLSKAWTLATQLSHQQRWYLSSNYHLCAPFISFVYNPHRLFFLPAASPGMPSDSFVSSSPPSPPFLSSPEGQTYFLSVPTSTSSNYPWTIDMKKGGWEIEFAFSMKSRGEKSR